MITSYGQITPETPSTRALFPELVRQVENSSDYQFYFDPALTDTLTIPSSALRYPMPEILDNALLNTGFFYHIDTLSRVFITYQRQLRPDLPENFFTDTGTNEDFDVAIFDYMYDADQKKRLTEEEVILEIGPRSNKITEARAVITGQVRNVHTGESIAGAVIYNQSSGNSTTTDPFGFYTLTIPTGRNTLEISFLGMMPAKRELMVFSKGDLDIELSEKVISLREVIIRSERDANISSTSMGVDKIDISTLKQVPAALGEADILKVVLTLPGVQTVGESSTGLNVRGGATDQNLILFDNAVIYNPSHLFGFFSAFNPDVVKEVELYKSGVPAAYGGRLSSVMTVTSREGNKKKFAGSGGIGLITGRLTLEGPIKKDKTSFLIGGRSTYSDWLLKQIPDRSLQNSAGSFYDVNLHINHEANSKNSFDLTGYFSKDKFRLNSDTLYSYSNMQSTFQWKHSFNKKLYGAFTASFSRYEFDIESTKNEINAFSLNSAINQYSAKADLSYFRNDDNEITFGASVIRYGIDPGDLSPYGESSLIIPEKIEEEQAFESAVYISDRFQLSDRLTLDAGLRFSFYQYLGPQTFFDYSSSLLEESTVTDTLTYDKGSTIANYQGPEYRLSARYSLNNTSSLKFSAQRMRQYIHMVSNTTAVAPTNMWKLSDRYIRPQVGDQISLGYYKNFKSNTIETSVEVYYKAMTDFLDYKNGAVLLLNENIETDVLNTEGKAYGAEFLVRKLTGKLNGWISYTYSRSLLRSDTENYSINNGEYYSSNFDKPHDVTVISNYRFSKRFSISVNFTYSTGRPITIPIGKYVYEGSERLAYSDRNEFRIPDYYRADFSMNIEGNHKVNKLAHSSWSLSIYNLTGRNNAYSVFFRSEEGTIKAYQLSIFTDPIPTITYNFRF
jgi:hypothetical protein